MKLTRSTSVLEFKLVSSFDAVRKKLLAEKFADRLEKPLAYWALPNDRRLPLAFMGRSLKDLLDTPFEELYATPGIGQKKIYSLVELLARAAKEQPPGALPPLEEEADEAAGNTAAASKHGERVDLSIVSEALWVQWRATVTEQDLGGETLGRFAISLQKLPRVIWHTPLETYSGLTLAEIRELKTHGEKRVRAVLEVFGSLHSILAHAGKQDHLSVRLVPRFVRDVESWLLSVLRRDELPSAEEIQTAFVSPLMRQVEIDAGSQIHRLAENRLGLRGANSSVRQAARKMGLTRARVYQLLNEISAVMDVRWPEGQALAGQLQARLLRDASNQQELETFYATVELFFPATRGEVGEETSDEENELAVNGTHR